MNLWKTVVWVCQVLNIFVAASNGYYFANSGELSHALLVVVSAISVVLLSCALINMARTEQLDTISKELREVA